MRRAWVVVALLALAPRLAEAQAVRLCTTEWPPYTVGSGAVVDGVHTRMVLEAFRRVGLKATIDSVAWERCWNELAKGSYDGIYSASYNDERAQVARYPWTPLQSLSYVAVVRRGQGRDWTGDDLGKLPQPLASPRGYSITAILRKAVGAVDDGAMKDAQNLEKLVAGRVGTAVVEAAVARVLIRDMGIADRVEVLPAPVGPPRDYFLVIGHKAGGSEAASSDLTSRLDAVLEEIRREGMVDRLLNEAGVR
ncbi:MAG TPA: transporter substrate-binding domain-containing protein [Candidatus Omnitrophota bacterium]|nr:transporter substrate-binding domain-containing protein [Candidatus Omnitrophota bacterium]